MCESYPIPSRAEAFRRELQEKVNALLQAIENYDLSPRYVAGAPAEDEDS